MVANWVIFGSKLVNPKIECQICAFDERKKILKGLKFIQNVKKLCKRAQRKKKPVEREKGLFGEDREIFVF